MLAVIGWLYLFLLGRHTCISICFLSNIRCVSFFSNKWILSIFCERQISIKLCFVSITSMHSQLLGYLLWFLLCHYVSFRAEFRVVLPVTIPAYKRCSVRRYHQLFVGVSMSLLRYMCLLAHGGVQCILCFVFLSFVYLMLPLSLDCPLLTASSVFSNVYLNNNYYKNDFLYDKLNTSYTYMTFHFHSLLS